ncbi:MAG: phosphate ABC transporter permease PstA [Methanomicrobiales archaeon]
MMTSLWFICAVFAVVVVCFILVFLLYNGYPAFSTIGLPDFLFGDTWSPTGNPPLYGIYPLIIDTLLVMALAMLIAIPLGIASAIYISELAHKKVKAVVKPAVELLAGIPSVVFGFFGLVVLTELLRVSFDVPSGECWLAGSILLGIMALPTIISVSEDAISSVPKEFREGSLATGATKWQTISRVVVPAALSGITAAVILGIGRAIGETMAVLMVTGNAAVIPSPIWNVLSPVRTLTATLGIEMGEVAVGSLHYSALFGIAVVLLIITLVINLTAYKILGRIRAGQTGVGAGGRKYLSHKTADSLKKYGLYVIVALTLLFVFIAAGLIAGLVCILAVILWYVLREKLNQRQVQKAAFSILWIAIGAVLVILGCIIADIVINGLPAISWEFLTTAPKNLGRDGGIAPAIVGTFYLVLGAILIALPLGIGAAIYLNEYTREGRITRTIRTGVDLLNGTPSIVFGLFGFAFLVLYLKFGVSLLAGQVTLALMVLPTMIRTAEESLKNVPMSVREGSLALGATKWQTVRSVVLPPAVPGIITGTILSIGRAAGETAPILFTAVVFSSRTLPTSEFEPVMALPYHLYILSTNVPGATTNQYGTALVLLILVIGFYLAAIIVRRHYHMKIRW